MKNPLPYITRHEDIVCHYSCLISNMNWTLTIGNHELTLRLWANREIWLIWDNGTKNKWLGRMSREWTVKLIGSPENIISHRVRKDDLQMELEHLQRLRVRLEQSS